MPLSIYPKATLGQFLRFTSYALFFIVTVHLLDNTDRLRKTAFVLSCFGGLYAFWGLMQFFAPGQRILWILAPWPKYLSHAFGSYVNGNHYAGLMEMLFPLTLCCFIFLTPKSTYGSWRDRLIELITESSTNRHILVGFSAVLIIASIFFSLSRGGTLSTIFTTLLLFALLTFTLRTKGKALVLLLVLVCTLGLVGVFGWQPIIKRFDGIYNAAGELSDLRPHFWKDSLELIADYPVFGSGFGSFADSYPRYQTIPTGERTVRHAHNDYLELAADGGALGFLLTVCFLVSLLRHTWPAWRRRRNSVSKYLYIGSLCGISAILLHSVTDFNLAIPPNGLFFFFLCGLMVASANVRSKNGWQGLDLPLANPVRSKLLVPLCALILVFGSLFNGGILLARGIYAPLKERQLDQLDREDKAAALQRIRSASWWDPLSSRYRYAETMILDALERKVEALEVYQDVLKLRPMRGEYLQKAGKLANSLEQDDLGGLLLLAGMEAQPSKIEYLKEYLGWLLKQKRNEDALIVLRRGLQLHPQQTSSVLTLVDEYNLDHERVRFFLPERAQCWQIYAEYLASREDEGSAELAYRHALDLVAEEKTPRTKPFWSYYKFLQERKRNPDALNLMLAGIERFPKNAGFRRTAGSLYEKQGITYRAIEEYQQALLLDPRKAWVRERLEKLQSVRRQ